MSPGGSVASDPLSTLIGIAGQETGHDRAQPSTPGQIIRGTALGGDCSWASYVLRWLSIGPSRPSTP
jgi:hypothetical protein